MSQTNTTTNNRQNQNQISQRGGRGHGANDRGYSDCRKDCGNNSITNRYLSEGKMKEK